MKNVKIILQQLIYRQATAIFLCSCILCSNSLGQSGGPFAIERSVIASGGTSSSGAFNVMSAIGQPAAGTISGGAFTLDAGFITPGLGPTAAGVSISGRVLTFEGNGIRNAIVEITDTTGTLISARTSSMGYFRFEDVEAGQTYIISVRSKRFQFASQVVTVNDQIGELNFVAQN